MKIGLTDGSNLFIGNKTVAQYIPSEEAMYRHNVFIEALPPVFTPEEVCSLLIRRPAYHKDERLKEPHHRLQSVQTISHLVEPFKRHFELEQIFSRMIRNGYMSRNPISVEWKKQIRSGFPDIDWGSNIPGYSPIIRSNSVGFCVIGMSGVGKTTAVESILSLYPQIIIHSQYNEHSFNHAQLVWLKIDCPHDGSLKGLCLNFFQAIDLILDTRYYKSVGRKTLNELLPEMATLAANLGLGVLVIDEIQRLKDVKKTEIPGQMLNFFVHLSDNIGVPVVLVGTFKALPLLTRELAIARRNEGESGFLWWNEERDQFWDNFIENLWKYQWTNVETPLTPKIKEALYKNSQGIVDIAVKLYQLAQWEIIGTEDESITPQLINYVANEKLKISKSILQAICDRDVDKLVNISDVFLPEQELGQFYEKSYKRVITIRNINAFQKQQATSRAAEETEETETPVFRIAKWLVEADFEPKIARQAAVDSLSRFPNQPDFKKARETAYEIAKTLISNTSKPLIEEKKRKNIPKQEPVLLSDDLRNIVQLGHEKNLTGYDALKEAGLIKSVKEFLN